jgi:hypothetical protein
MYFDPVGKVSILLVKPSDGKRNRPPAPLTLRTYDAAEKKWAKLAPQGAWPPEWTKASLCWFDPAHNVFVVNTCRETWVYRYKTIDKE